MQIAADELPRFMQCNGSQRFAVAPLAGSDHDDTIRQEGIAVHYMITAVWNGEFADTTELVDRRAPNGVYMTVEMSEHADEYLGYLLRRITDGGESPVASYPGAMEHPLEIARHNYIVGCRPDYIRHNTVSDTLYVDDFKYGYSHVEPDDNWTLVAHAVAYQQTYGVAPRNYVFTIHQPRSYHHAGTVRFVRYSYQEIAERFAALNHALMNPRDSLHTGPFCRNCAALHDCAAATAAAMNAVDTAGGLFRDDWTDAKLAHAMVDLERAQAMIKQKAEALAELTTHRLRAGRVVGDYALVRSVGNRRWKDGLDPAVLQAMTGVDLSSPAKAVSPAQAERRGVDSEIVAMLTDRPSTGTKLVRESATKRAKRYLENGN